MLKEDTIKSGVIQSDNLKQIIIKFFKDNDVTCEETIYQTDRVIENACDLLGVLFNEVKDGLKEPCDSCGEKTLDRESIILDGTDDFYNLEVCEECYDRLSDCYTPEQVDKLMRVRQ